MIINLKKEISYLYLIQILNIIFPLIIMGYIGHIMGADSFGKMAFYFVLTNIFIFFIDFGFNLVGARYIGLYVDDKEQINLIYSNVQIIKLSIYFLLLFLVFSLIYILDGFYFVDFDFNIIKMAVVFSIATILSSAWVYNGFGINSKNAIIVFIFKIISILIVLLLVSGANDLFLCIFIQGFLSVLSGFFSFFYLIKNKIIRFSFLLFRIKNCKDFFFEASDIFWASFSTFVFTYGNPIFIKFYFGDKFLGLYFAAEKVVSFLKMFFNPLIQSYYSRMCYLNNNNQYKKMISSATKIYYIFISAIFISLLLNFALGDYIYKIVFGADFNIKNIVFILIINQIFISLAMILVNLLIVPMGGGAELKKYYLLGMCLHLSYFYFFVVCFDFNGVLISTLLTEFFVTLLLLSYFKKHLKIHVK